MTPSKCHITKNAGWKNLKIFTGLAYRRDGESKKKTFTNFKNFTCPARRSTYDNEWTGGFFQPSNGVLVYAYFGLLDYDRSSTCLVHSGVHFLGLTSTN